MTRSSGITAVSAHPCRTTTMLPAPIAVIFVAGGRGVGAAATQTVADAVGPAFNDIAGGSDLVATDRRLHDSRRQRRRQVDAEPVAVARPFAAGSPQCTQQRTQQRGARRRSRAAHLSPSRSNRRHAPECRFAPDGHRAGIGDVFGDVASVVDAGEHQIRAWVRRRTAPSSRRRRSRPAIPSRRRRARRPATAEILIERQLMACRPSICARGRRSTSQRRQCCGGAGQISEAGCRDAVIVADENAHDTRSSEARAGRRSRDRRARRECAASAGRAPRARDE